MANTAPKHLWTTRDCDILIGDESELMLIDVDTFRCIKLVLSVHDLSDEKVRTKEYSISRITNDVSYSCYGVVGSSLKFEVNIGILLNKLSVRIKNNELFNLKARANFMLLA